MAENESRLIVAAQITGELESAVALGAVRENGDCAENIAEAQLAAMKDRAGRDGELLAAALALPDWTALEVIMLKASTLRADRLAFCVLPAELCKRLRGLLV